MVLTNHSDGALKMGGVFSYVFLLGGAYGTVLALFFGLKAMKLI